MAHPLSQYAIQSLPGAYYISNFFEPTQEVFYSQHAASVRGSSKRGITRVNGPAVHAFVADNDDPQELNYPKFICDMIKELKARQVLPEDPMQVSVNKYPKEYQMVPHKDGKGSQGAIVTFFSHTTLDFYLMPEEGPPSYTRVYAREELEHVAPVSLLLEPNSVLLISGPSFTEYVHAIWPRQDDVVQPTLGNYHLLSNKKDGVTFQRTDRVSMVLWNT